MARSLGADRVIDYTTADFTRGGQRYDLLSDNAGNRSLSECRRILAPHGTLVRAGAAAVPSGGRLVVGMLQVLLVSRFTSQRFISFVTTIGTDDLAVLGDLVEAGKVTPVIDRTYPLSETADAMRYLAGGHARGKIVITV